MGALLGKSMVWGGAGPTGLAGDLGPALRDTLARPEVPTFCGQRPPFQVGSDVEALSSDLKCEEWLWNTIYLGQHFTH